MSQSFSFTLGKQQTTQFSLLQPLFTANQTTSMSAKHTHGSGFCTDQIWWNKSELPLSFLVLLQSISHMTHQWGCYYGLVYLFDRFVRKTTCFISRKSCLPHNAVWDGTKTDAPLIHNIPTHLIISYDLCYLHIQMYYNLYYISIFWLSKHLYIPYKIVKVLI